MIPDKLNAQIEQQMADTRRMALESCAPCNEGACKPIHGAPVEKDVPCDMVPVDPHGSGFKTGDLVTYTNDQGVKFEFKVRGFAKEKHSPEFGNPRWIYLFKDAWWFPVNPRSLKITQPQTTRP